MSLTFIVNVGTQAKTHRKSANFHVKGTSLPPIIFARIDRMPYNFVAAIFTQINFVADFLQAKCDFTRKTAVMRF